MQMLSRDIENMRSLLLGQLRSIGSLEEDAQAWNRVWCEHPRAWKGLVQKFVSASLDFEKQQGFESGKLVLLRRQEVPELSVSVQNVPRCFSAPEQGPLTNPGCMASGGQLWPTQGMKNVPAVLATFIREFGWSTLCRTRQ